MRELCPPADDGPYLDDEPPPRSSPSDDDAERPSDDSSPENGYEPPVRENEWRLLTIDDDLGCGGNGEREGERSYRLRSC